MNDNFTSLIANLFLPSRRSCIRRILCAVCVFVCVCVCAQNTSESYERILINVCEVTERVPRKNRLDSGGNPLSCVDPGSFSDSLLSRVITYFTEHDSTFEPYRSIIEWSMVESCEL